MDQATHPVADTAPITPEYVSNGTTAPTSATKPKQRSRRKHEETEDEATKRRCVISTACIACRKRKSKCDGAQPSCAACSSVYGSECIYDPNSDHRRKGVYKNDIDNLKTRNSTLQTLITALLNLQEHEAFDLVREIRTCESLDGVAEKIAARENGEDAEDEGNDQYGGEYGTSQTPSFEKQLYGKMGDLRLDEGSVRYIGGTSHLLHIDEDDDQHEADEVTQHDNAVASWTRVTDDSELILHLLNMYFTWHYTYFTALSKILFYRHFSLGYSPTTKRKTHYCSPLLVNAMLALGCHFTSHKGARANPDDSATAGDHFFKEAKRLILEGDLHEIPRLTTVQALALMSVREAGCAREAKGWVYSGMSFRMLQDMGLNLNTGRLTTNKNVNGDEAEEDVRRITFWGCFLFDKCWSNYLGRMPQLPMSMVTVPKPEVFPDEEAVAWTPYSDSGPSQANTQPSRTRAVALQITKLCEISSDLMNHFYNPTEMEKSRGRSHELKLLSSVHTRLEAWRKDLPKEMEPREGGLASILVMHMFFQLLYIHLFRPFLKYTQATSPLPQTVSPRKLCTQAAQMISKLMRLYKRSHGLRQICNIAVYILHSACTIHLLNLPDKNARRDIVHGVKNLEEIAEGWLCARRTLGILSMLARKWKVELPDEASAVLQRTDGKFGPYANETTSPRRADTSSPQMTGHIRQPSNTASMSNGYFSDIATSKPPGSAALQAIPSVSSPHNYPPATNTPQDSRTRNLGTTQTASPSDMFGGVDQLLRESQDWVMRDQTQLANGFENWGGVGVGMDPSIWNGVPSSMNGMVDGTLTAAPMATGMPVPAPPPQQCHPPFPTTTGVVDQGFPPMEWLSNGYPNIGTYDTNDWYHI